MEDISEDLVTFQIQGHLLKCSRTALIQHSDYFKAMLEGSFAESSKDIIPLKGIDLEAMNIILKLLWDREYVIAEENILMVLQASCMLQFLEIKATCLEHLRNILCKNNCVQIWLNTELLDVPSVYLKAKLTALLEFMSVKETSVFLELNMKQLINYVGNINLQCWKEYDVLEAIMRWLENSEEKDFNVMLKLLHCIDFTAIGTDDVHKTIANSVIAEHTKVVNVLQCILAIKEDCSTANFEADCVQIANSLLQSKCRNTQGFPFVLFDCEGGNPIDLVHCNYIANKYKRKRQNSAPNDAEPSQMSIMCIDDKLPSLVKVFIGLQQAKDLEGFKMVGYKQFAFLFGGEYILGKGNWNFEFYAYNMLKNTLELKQPMPFARRHFAACLSGNRLYIVGGTGQFRTIKSNMFWYNLEKENWSELHNLPCPPFQIKCCDFNEKLFILNCNYKRAYIFCPIEESWTDVNVSDADNILPNYSTELSMFTYRSSIFIKERALFELKIQGDNLVVVNKVDLPVHENWCQSDAVLRGNILYNLRQHQWSKKFGTLLELLNMDTLQISTKYCTTNEESKNFDNEVFKLSPPLQIFSFFHENLVDGNDLVNIIPDFG